VLDGSSWIGGWMVGSRAGGSGWMVGLTIGSGGWMVGLTIGSGGWNKEDTGFGLLDRTVVLGRITGVRLEGCMEDCLRVCPNMVGALVGGGAVPE